MNYITILEFQKQSKEIQQAFINWWQPQIGDIYCDMDCYGCDDISVIKTKEKQEIISIDKKHGYYIPLLKEGQLRQFIEDTIQDKLQVCFDGGNYGGYFYSFNSFKGNLNNFENINIKNVNYLESIWNLAMKIARK